MQTRKTVAVISGVALGFLAFGILNSIAMEFGIREDARIISRDFYVGIISFALGHFIYCWVDVGRFPVVKDYSWTSIHRDPYEPTNNLLRKVELIGYWYSFICLTAYELIITPIYRSNIASSQKVLYDIFIAGLLVWFSLKKYKAAVAKYEEKVKARHNVN